MQKGRGIAAFLILGAVFFFLAAWKTGALSLAINADSALFFDLSKKPFSFFEALSSIRTLGYPLFVRFSLIFSNDWHATPILQYWMLVLCVGIFFHGLRALFKPWHA